MSSIGPAGFFSIIAATSPQTSALAAPLAQTQSSDVDRVAQDVAGQARETDMETQAEEAAGIGQTDGEEHGSNERDADGRRLWEKPLGSAATAGSEEELFENDVAGTEHKSKDASGESGGQLDLMG